MICNFWEVLDGSESLGAAALDFDGNIKRANMAFSRIVSVDTDDLVGMNVVDLTEPSHRQASRMKILSLGNGERDRLCITKQYVRPNGLPVWCQVEAFVMSDPQTQERLCIVLFAWQLAESQVCSQHSDEIDTHLKMLQELIRLTANQNVHDSNPGININVQGGDVHGGNMTGGSEYKQVADRGGKISSKHNDSIVLIVIAICVTVVLCVGLALYAGGYLRLNHGDNRLEVGPGSAPSVTAQTEK